MIALITLCIWLGMYYSHIWLLLGVAVKSSVIVLFAGGVVQCLKMRSAIARCWIWRCALIGLLALLVFGLGVNKEFQFPLTVKSPAAGELARLVKGTLAAKVMVVNSPAEIQKRKEEQVEKMRAHQVPPWEVEEKSNAASTFRGNRLRQLDYGVAVIWVGVAALLIVIMAIRIIAGTIWLRRQGLEADARLQGIAQRVGDELNVRSQVHVCMMEKLASPLLLGLTRPQIYLPMDATRWDERKLGSVFLHELAHWRRRDHLWKYLGQIVKCVLWWNPLVSRAVEQMSVEAEEAADDTVLLHHTEAKFYAAALVEIAVTAGAPTPLGISMIGSLSLERRITALLVENPWRGRIGRSAWLITGVLVLFVVGASIYLRPASIAEEASKSVRTLSLTQRASLERIVTANIKRLTALRFIHFRLEQDLTYTENGKSLVASQPTVMEAWADEWTGMHRAEFRPEVIAWPNGSTPFSIKNVTKINNGEALFTFEQSGDPNNPDHQGPAGLEFYLGMREMNDLVVMGRKILAMQSLDSSGSFAHWAVDEETKNGRPFVRIREEFSSDDNKVVQQRTLLVDPTRDDLLVLSEWAFPASHPECSDQWLLEKVSTANDGTLYPAEYRATSQSFSKVTKVTALEVLPSLPMGILDPPKSAEEKYR